MEPFKDRLLEALKRFFSSVKVITAFAGLLGIIAAKHNILLSPDDVKEVLVIIGILIGAQGASDFGVRKAQIEAAAPKPPEAIMTQVNEAERKL